MTPPVTFKKNAFDPNVAFFKLPFVKYITYLFGMLFIITSCHITVDLCITMYRESIPFPLGYELYGKILRHYTIPISILASLLPIMGLLAVNHRSEQTNQQIQTALNQNNFINHFKHIEEFSLYFNAHLKEVETERVTVPEPRVLHGHLFKNTKEGVYDVYQASVQFLDASISGFLNLLTKLDGASFAEYQSIMEDCIKYTKNTANHFQFILEDDSSTTDSSYKRFQNEDNIGFDTEVTLLDYLVIIEWGVILHSFTFFHEPSTISKHLSTRTRTAQKIDITIKEGHISFNPLEYFDLCKTARTFTPNIPPN